MNGASAKPVGGLLLSKNAPIQEREAKNGRKSHNRYAQGSTRCVNERREVRGVNCNCGPGSSGGRGDDEGGEHVSYRY